MFDAGDIILGAVQGIFVGTDIDAHMARSVGAGPQPFGYGDHAFIVEAKAIDHGLVARQAEQARAGIADLRQRRDSSDFRKAKAKTEHGIHGLGVFVKACGNADRIGKIKASNSDMQAWIVLRGFSFG